MSMLKKTKLVPLKSFIARRGLFSHEDELPEHLKHIYPELILGRKILDRAVLDSIECSATKHWFDVFNEDFNEICFIAYLDPEIAVERFLETHTKLLNEEFIQDIYEGYEDYE